MDPTLSVREMQQEDIDLIVSYWQFSDPAHLVGMGVDLAKLPTQKGLEHMLSEQLQLPLEARQSYALIWSVNGQPVGHTNVNAIHFGQYAHMHLHLWQSAHRQQGLGTALVTQSLPFFFEKLHLQALYCEPYALNPAPNRTLAKVGFAFQKHYRTTPGPINFEQEVNQWKLTRERYQDIMKSATHASVV